MSEQDNGARVAPQGSPQQPAQEQWQRPIPEQRQQVPQPVLAPQPQPQPPLVPAPAAPGRRKRLMVGGGIVAAALLLLVAVVVVSSKPKPAAAPAGDGGGYGWTPPATWKNPNDDVLTAFVQRRGRALMAGDEAGWLAGIDPKNTDLIAREKWRFANLRQLPLTSFASISRGSRDFILAAQMRSGHVWVGEVMRLGVDVDYTATSAEWTLSWDGDKLMITEIGPTTGVHSDDKEIPHAPWNEVALRSVTADGVTIMAPVGGQWDPATYLPAARKAAALVRTLWGKRRGPSGFLVFLANEKQFARWNLADGDTLPAAVGVTTYPGRFAENGTPLISLPDVSLRFDAPLSLPRWKARNAGARIGLNMSAIKTVPQAQSVLVHEMAHAMGPHLIDGSRVDISKDKSAVAVEQATWPIEGFARYVQYLDDPSLAAQNMDFVRQKRSTYPTPYLFPSSVGFYDGPADRVSYYYNLSSSLFLATDRALGRQKALDLYIALTNSSESGSRDKIFLDTIMENIGITPAKVWPVWHSLTGK